MSVQLQRKATPFKLILTVSPDTAKLALDEYWSQIKDHLELDGFRKGHVPKEKAENTFGFDKLYGEVITKLYYDELEANKLDIVHSSNLSIPSLPINNKPLIMENEVYLRPEVTLADPKNIKLQTQKPFITIEEIDKQIEHLQDQFAEFEVIDKVIELGDFVDFHYEGLASGKPFDARDTRIEIGAKKFIPGFEDALLGLKTAELKSFNITFPDKYFEPSLAGKEVVFNVKIHKVLTKVIQPWSEIQLKKLDVDSLEALKIKITDQLLNKKEEIFEKTQKAETITQYTELCEIEPIPEVNIKDELEKGWEAHLERLGQTEEELLKEHPTAKDFFFYKEAPQVQQAMKSSMVLGAIVKQQAFDTTDEEIKEHFNQKYKGHKDLDALIKSNFESPMKLQHAKGRILVEKAIQYLLINAQKENL